MTEKATRRTKKKTGAKGATRQRKKTDKKPIPVINKKPDICPICKSKNTLKTNSSMKCKPMGIMVRWRDCSVCHRRIREEQEL